MPPHHFSRGPTPSLSLSRPRRARVSSAAGVRQGPKRFALCEASADARAVFLKPALGEAPTARRLEPGAVFAFVATQAVKPSAAAGPKDPPVTFYLLAPEADGAEEHWVHDLDALDPADKAITLWTTAMMVPCTPSPWPLPPPSAAASAAAECVRWAGGA